MGFKVNVGAAKSFLFENKNLKQTVLKNTIWLTVGTVLGRVIRAALIIYIARVLGAAGYGVFSYALNIAALFTVFTDVGLGAILTRETSKRPEDLKRYLSTSLVIKLCLLAAGGILIAGIGPSVTKLSGVVPLLPLAVVLVVFDSLRDLAFSITRAREKMQTEAAINVITNVAVAAFGVAVLIASPTERNLLIGYVMGSGVGFASALFALRSDFRDAFSFFDGSLVRKIIVEAWPFAIGGLLGAIMINTDAIMLGWLKEASDVGFYAAAQRPVQLLYVIPSMFVIGLFPTFSRLANNDDERFRSIFEQGVKLALLLAFPMMVGGVILAEPMTVLLFGPEYLPAALPFAVLMLTLVMQFPSTLFGNALFAYNRQKLFIVSAALGAFGNAIFNLLLIPRYGATGAAFATVIAQIIFIGFLWFKTRQITGFRVLPHIGKIIASTAIMGGLVCLLELLGVNLIANIAVSAFAYFLSLHLLKDPLLDKSRILDIFK